MTRVFKIYLKINEPILKIMRPEQLGKLLMLQFGIPTQYAEMLGEEMKRMDPAVDGTGADAVLSGYPHAG